MTATGEYSLADATYAKLLQQLSEKKFEGTSTELRANILDFYSSPPVPADAKSNQGHGNSVPADLDQLKAMIPIVATDAARGTSNGGTTNDRTTPNERTGVCSADQ
jgi:hypothetical protein